jgi:hypothetical protein
MMVLFEDKSKDLERIGTLYLDGNKFIAEVESKITGEIQYFESEIPTEAINYLHCWGIASPPSKRLNGYFTEYEEAIMFLTGGE